MQNDQEFDVSARKEAFEQATQELIQQTRQLSTIFNFSVPYEIGETVRKIRNMFQIPDIRRQVLNPKWEKINFEDARYTEGFCAITSYVFSNAFKPSDGPNPWQIMQFTNVPTFGTHVWLKFIPTDEILDLTFDQFITYDGIRMSIPYHKGNVVIPKFNNPGLDKFIDNVTPEFAAMVRQNIASKI